MTDQQQKKRVQRIVRLLEDRFGEPKWPGPRDFLADLIWTLLSQNTNDKNAETAYIRLRERFPDWTAVLKSPLTKIIDAVRPAGLGQQKARSIKALLQWVDGTYGTFALNFLCQEESSKIRDLFITQKGIGVKTISVALMSACGHDVFPVDTHVHRICRRLALVPDRVSAEKTHVLMQPLMPAGKCYSLHINMLKLGRTLCKARQPECPPCPLVKLCPSADIK
jgi:endonuclease III